VPDLVSEEEKVSLLTRMRQEGPILPAPGEMMKTRLTGRKTPAALSTPPALTVSCPPFANFCLGTPVTRVTELLDAEVADPIAIGCSTVWTFFLTFWVDAQSN
jgi:hypothetical protein